MLLACEFEFVSHGRLRKMSASSLRLGLWSKRENGTGTWDTDRTNPYCHRFKGSPQAVVLPTTDPGDLRLVSGYAQGSWGLALPETKTQCWPKTYAAPWLAFPSTAWNGAPITAVLPLRLTEYPNASLAALSEPVTERFGSNVFTQPAAG